MKETEVIKERRKKKFLDKINDQNKDYEETKKKPSKNKIIMESEENFTHKKKTKLYEEDNNIDNDNNNNIDYDNNNDLDNHKNSNKINFFDNFNKINKYEYIKNILDLFKKIFVIVLTLFHCLKYLSLDDSTKLKYSLLILEISSFLVNKLFRMRMKKFIKNNSKVEYEIIDINDNKSKNDFGLNRLIKFLEKIIKSIVPYRYVFEIFGFVMNILTDIAILFITNVIFFIINEDDE
jgi:hypothetical protein